MEDNLEFSLYWFAGNSGKVRQTDWKAITDKVKSNPNMAIAAGLRQYYITKGEENAD